MCIVPKKYFLGFGLVEVLIGVSLVTVIGVYVGITVSQSVQVRNEIIDNTNKVYLAEEGYEIIRLLRDENWSNLSSLSLNTPYHLQVATTTLAIGGSSEIIDNKYSRNFLVQSVYRDGSGNIVASTTSGSAVDTDTLNIFVYVGDSNSTTSMQGVLANFP